MKYIIELMMYKNTKSNYKARVMIGIPTLGQVRIEWHNALNGLVIPVNWSNSVQTPTGFTTVDAQNLIVKDVLEKNFEWLIFIEDDIVVPADLLAKFNQYIFSKEFPIVSGLYFLKGTIPEPLIFRGRGNGTYRDFKFGDIVKCDGVPTGCLLIHTSILRLLSDGSKEYTLRANEASVKLKRIFQTPREVYIDSETGSYVKKLGTSDLFMCDAILKDKLWKLAGWDDLDEENPFIVDTSIQCGHIDLSTGVNYGIFTRSSHSGSSN